MSDGLLELMRSRYPHIDWERPIDVEVFGTGIARMCCRICIATQGIKSQEVAELGFDSFKDFKKHLKVEHGS